MRGRNALIIQYNIAIQASTPAHILVLAFDPPAFFQQHLHKDDLHHLGEPLGNCYIEIFQDTLRNERPSRETARSLREAQAMNATRTSPMLQ
jgi:hypothetical protein